MSQAKLFAGACALAVAAVAFGAVAQDKPAEQPPLWAFPGNQPAKPADPNKTETLPGSNQKFMEPQIRDRTTAVDWFPNGHPAMPTAVKGGVQGKFACGFCHLPEGPGRTESQDVAGMPADYLYRQLLDMKNNTRTQMDSHYGPQGNMIITAKAWSDADLRAAADYFAKLKYPAPNHVKVVEAAEVPAHRANAFVYEFEKGGAKEPIGERIIEGPDDFERFELRDWRVAFTAYVPPGAVARGAALAKGDSVKGLPACDTCHGAGLKGGAIAPPIAGRYPTGIFRQLYAFKTGARNSVPAGFMKPMVASLSQKDMIDLAAYVGSLKP
ncbi:MAG: c-type cytochrome [Caulobacteraceae bacterium]